MTATSTVCERERRACIFFQEQVCRIRFWIAGYGHGKAKRFGHSDAFGLLQERVEGNLEHVEVDAVLPSAIFIFVSFTIHPLTLNPSCVTVSSCCMCYSVKSLFHELGVNPAVHELDEEPKGAEMEKALVKLLGRRPAVPAIFIGGRLVGSTDRILSLHLSGKLVPLLRDAGALWL
ncbi:hypothetical protein GW17_00005601 [Ensete ventricosum]|nr:hypothetical protein GW17_00005601 [Ensete ventricosum]RZR98327.1 hypothetical protein BHM03_00027656 [Ensete ventricosum]